MTFHKSFPHSGCQNKVFERGGVEVFGKGLKRRIMSYYFIGSI